MVISENHVIGSESCADLLDRSRRLFDQNRRVLFWTILLGFIVAFVSMAINLGALEITNFKIGETEVLLKKPFLLRLFFTLSSLGIVLGYVLCHVVIVQHYETVRFLAEECQYERASIVMRFAKWEQKSATYNAKKVLVGVLHSSVIVLFGILPCSTFIFSLFRS
jgi:hypothetical protein